MIKEACVETFEEAKLAAERCVSSVDIRELP